MNPRSTRLLLPLALALAAVLECGLASTARAQADLPTEFADAGIVSGLDWPGSLAFLPDGRLLTIECKTAKIRMIVGGALAAVDPVGVVDSVATLDEEQGLAGLAVDPRWPVKPYLYVMYTGLDANLHISRLTAQGNLSSATSGNLSIVPGSRRELIRDVPDTATGHNGCCLHFGPDSMLYASFGDDMLGCLATDPTALWGVLTRLDVRHLPDAPGPPDKQLLVPADNPFVNSIWLNERLVYARGFRNPFRFTIDKPTGRIFVCDVGWESYEEVDLLDAPGLDLGWPFFEGPQPYVTTNECGVSVPTDTRLPIHYYSRAEYCPYPNPLSCAAAVMGGAVLHNVPSSPVSFPASYNGQFIFSDYYEGAIWRLRDSLGTWVRAPAVIGQPNTRDWARGFVQVSDYLQAADGSLYYALDARDFASESGEIRRITYRNLASVPLPSRAAAAFSAIYPSPTTGSATMLFALTKPASFEMDLYDALGRRVRQIVPRSDQAAGEHRVWWDGRDERGHLVAPGVYIARLTVDGAAMERRLPVLP